MSSESDRCLTCDNTAKWHRDNPGVVHPFNDGTVPHQATFGRRRADGSKEPVNGPQRASEPAGMRPPEMQSRWPFDPVLRQALINKGVLTPQDLRDAEEQIRSITAQFESEARNGS